jgi:hypothetical protein
MERKLLSAKFSKLKSFINGTGCITASGAGIVDQITGVKWSGSGNFTVAPTGEVTLPTTLTYVSGTTPTLAGKVVATVLALKHTAAITNTFSTFGGADGSGTGLDFGRSGAALANNWSKDASNSGTSTIAAATGLDPTATTILMSILDFVNGFGYAYSIQSTDLSLLSATSALAVNAGGFNGAWPALGTAFVHNFSTTRQVLQQALWELNTVPTDAAVATAMSAMLTNPTVPYEGWAG